MTAVVLGPEEHGVARLGRRVLREPWPLQLAGGRGERRCHGLLGVPEVTRGLRRTSEWPWEQVGVSASIPIQHLSLLPPPNHLPNHRMGASPPTRALGTEYSADLCGGTVDDKQERQAEALGGSWVWFLAEGPGKAHQEGGNDRE